MTTQDRVSIAMNPDERWANGEGAVELRADDVTKVFGTRRGRGEGVAAVSHADIRVRQNEFVAIVGESGSGKSTLARMLLGLIEPTGGEVFFNDVPLSKIDRKSLKQFRRSVQAVLQDPSGSLNPRKTVEKSLAEVIRLHKIVRGRRDTTQRVAQVLEQVGLDPALYLHRYPHELSGGQRQRVLIARALVLEPALIVADEAVSALDVSIKAGILQLMRDLHESMGIGYVFITHDLPVVKKVASYIYVMRHGELVEHGTKDKLFNSPEHPYTRELLAASPELLVQSAASDRGEVTQSHAHQWKTTTD
ncbi:MULTISPECIES: ABC transporter ATP-binding protein [unclassified Diaminobutyricimonas]|uniref:ABC transporter ATP-binding protein n=1 Tax=unclassified Diaminobutyricimonas TaxID=2643261 RepID=UPI0014205AC2|nr:MULTISPECIES: ABC transporter ATP-binding protein [unclassified Diaminobutyricimonas]